MTRLVNVRYCRCVMASTVSTSMSVSTTAVTGTCTGWTVGHQTTHTRACCKRHSRSRQTQRREAETCIVSECCRNGMYRSVTESLRGGGATPQPQIPAVAKAGPSRRCSFSLAVLNARRLIVHTRGLPPAMRLSVPCITLLALLTNLGTASRSATAGGLSPQSTPTRSPSVFLASTGAAVSRCRCPEGSLVICNARCCDVPSTMGRCVGASQSGVP